MKIERGGGLPAWPLVALATTFAFGLAFHQLGHESFWMDELETWAWAHLPFAEIWEKAAVQYHPPLYFWFMHGWARVGSSFYDEFWLRLPSAFFFALTVPMMYRLGRILGGTPRVGVFAAFLAATSPFLLHYGQEARSYAMLTFFAAWGFVVVAHLMSRCRTEQRPRLLGAGLRDACRPLARGDFRSARSALGDDDLWAAYILLSVIVMFLHSTAVLFAMVTGAILLCATWLAPSFRGLRFVNLCIAMAFIALGYSPHLLALLDGIRRIHRPFVTPGVEQVSTMFAQAYGIGHSGEWFWPTLFVLVGFAVLALIAWARKRAWDRVAFAVLGWLGALVLLTVFSFYKYVLLPKLLIWTLAPFLVACAAGLALLPRSSIRIVLLAGLLAVNLQGAPRVWSHVHQDWRTMAQLIARDASPGTAVVYCLSWLAGFPDLYWRRLEKQVSIDTYGLRITGEMIGGSGELAVLWRREGRRNWSPAGFGSAALFPRYRRVHVGGNCPRKWKDELHAALSEQGKRVETRELPGLFLSLYERRE